MPNLRKTKFARVRLAASIFVIPSTSFISRPSVLFAYLRICNAFSDTGCFRGMKIGSGRRGRGACAASHGSCFLCFLGHAACVLPSITSFVCLKSCCVLCGEERRACGGLKVWYVISLYPCHRHLHLQLTFICPVFLNLLVLFESVCMCLGGFRRACGLARAVVRRDAASWR
jgi:hypothetical protein